MPYRNLLNTLKNGAPSSTGTPSASTAISQVLGWIQACRGHTLGERLVLQEVSRDNTSLLLTFRLVNRRGRLRDPEPDEKNISDMILTLVQMPVFQDLLEAGATVAVDVNDPALVTRHTYKNFLGRIIRVKGSNSRKAVTDDMESELP